MCEMMKEYVIKTLMAANVKETEKLVEVNRTWTRTSVQAALA